MHVLLGIQTKTEEYEHKAEFILNFAKYVQWDPSVSGDEFYIGILGPSPLITELERLAAQKTVNGKKIVIRQFASHEELSFTHILFVSSQAACTPEIVLENPAIKKTLIVSETPGWAERGTAINFYNNKDDIKFEANPRAIKSAGLKASSQLLKLARVVEYKNLQP